MRTLSFFLVPVFLFAAAGFVGTSGPSAWAQPAGGARCADGDGSRFVTIDFPKATLTQASAVNARGQVAGWYVDSSLGIHGFLLSNGQFHVIDPPGSAQTTLGGINDWGEIAGTFLDLERGTGRGFLLAHGRFSPIDFPGSTQTAARGANNHGDVVGFYVDESDLVHGFMLTESGGFTTLPFGVVPTGINDRGDVAAGPLGLLRQGKLISISFPGSVFTEANGINDSGDVVGDFADGHAEHGFLLRRGRFTQIDVPGALLTQPTGINARGDIVGFHIKDGGVHGFLRRSACSAAAGP